MNEWARRACSKNGGFLDAQTHAASPLRGHAEVGRKGRERNRGASRFLPHFRLLRVKSQRASRKQKTTGAFTGRIRYSGAAEAKTGGSDQALSQVAERAEAIPPAAGHGQTGQLRSSQSSYLANNQANRSRCAMGCHVL